ncbi:signal peptidase I [Nocardioides sp. CF8]|uniref:signal peptidase I n=1 Tax=Nocardioides sp. CF8 TaxID=110319 RepID=UPI00032EB16A|nr:signal peptidase I [Nocardioides sp. CF8]EON23305.1 signal peptidase I [Nocardioides sp. CF8]
MTSHDRGLPPSDTQPEGSRSSSSQDGEKGSDRHHLPLWQETILLLAVALVLAIAIKALFLQAFYIPSESMEPGLVRDDRILVQKVSYWGGGEPQRGDVVVFKDPGGWLNAAESAGPSGTLPKVMAKIGLYPSGGHLVKRVIGVAGDVIECCDEKGRILVNGKPLDEETYVQDDKGTKCNGPMVNQCSTDWTAGPVPEGRVFVMGDNRGHSADSSQHMCKPAAETDCVSGPEFVPVDLVVGRVFVLMWPRERFDWVARPDTFEDIPAAS